MCRYLCRLNKGKNGENMYPANDDPETSYEIDVIMSYTNDMVPKLAYFIVPFLPQYKNKD